MDLFSLFYIDHNQYEYLDELNIDIPMSIWHEIQSLTNYEGDNFSIEDSSKLQENSSNHNIEQSYSSIIKELQDSDIHYPVNPLIDLEPNNCSEICDMFSQLPFYDLNDFIGEHISQNDDISLQEEANSDLEPFIHISFEEKTPQEISIWKYSRKRWISCTYFLFMFFYVPWSIW